MRNIHRKRVPARAQSKITGPLTTALVAFRMGRGRAEHYGELAFAMVLAWEIVHSVERHRHLIPDMKPAMDAINAIFERKRQRTVADAPWAAMPAEIDAIELAVEVYSSLWKVTPPKTIDRAMRKIGSAMERADSVTA